jgi:hypothetical protein
MIRSIGFVCLVTLCAATVFAAGPAFEQISPPGGFSGVEFKHLAMNAKGQFVAVAGSAVYVGDGSLGKLNRVLANDHLGFVLTEDGSDNSHDQHHRLTLEVLGGRLALNEAGDYVLASHTMLFVGNVSGGEPRKVFEDRNVNFQKVAINDAGHYAAITVRGVIAGQVSQAAAGKLIEQVPGTFQGNSILSSSGNWGVEVGETHLALNLSGQFVATTGAAVFGGSIPAMKYTKLYEDSKVNFRQLQLNENGTFVVLSTKNVFRGSLATR